MSKEIVLRRDLLPIAKVIGTGSKRLQKAVKRFNLSRQDLEEIAEITNDHEAKFHSIVRLMKMGLTIVQVNTCYETRAVLDGRCSLVRIVCFSRAYQEEASLDSGVDEVISEVIQAGQERFRYPDQTLKEMVPLAEDFPGISLEAALDILQGNHPGREFHTWGAEVFS